MELKQAYEGPILKSGGNWPSPPPRARVSQHPHWYPCLFEWEFVVAMLTQKMLDFNSKTLIYFKHGIVVIFRNNLNGFWDFYYGLGWTSNPRVVASSPKALLKEENRENLGVFPKLKKFGVSFSTLLFMMFWILKHPFI
jgi:hypothetical protein